MNTTTVLGALAAPVTGAFTVDPHRGQHRGEVSRQWAVRPSDQRFTSLDDLHASVAARRVASDLCPRRG